ncbi:unnamed protein product [Pieris brassicae]|uniref:Peroxisome assembly protein 12 n=1 Tax=Pieris brassicae TaxID=7116 RepID=A0A9P0THJ2_PIEBR|nr:unnamed protein product [Pieris brassicae]
MAVYAAHLTRTLQGTPSVFQVTAQEALGATVKPALRKLVEYLASVYPKNKWSERWYDELYLLIDCCLQYHYLKHYAASFSECFYGLMRVPLSSSNEFSTGHRLPVPLEKGSLALLVLLPYFRDKVEKMVNQWREDNEDGRLGKSNSDKARKAAVHLYSITHLVTEAVKLIILARYLTGSSRCPSPPLLLLGLTLTNAPPPEPEENTWSDLARNLFKGNIGRAMITFPMVWGAMAGAVQWGAFLVQFLRWWETRPGLTMDSLPSPPPPTREEKAVRYTNKCPVCLQSWKVPTVLPVSGYIFCYSCIARHLRANQTCPVTMLPATERSLVRLYIDT